MSRTVFHFLRAFMCISVVTCLVSEYTEIPLAVNHRDVQCLFKGQRGGCNNVNWENGKIDCDRLLCASRFATRPHVYVATNIGRAQNGTRCGPNSVCFLGSCRELPSHISMPEQIGLLSKTYECQKPVVGRPTIVDPVDHLDK